MNFLITTLLAIASFSLLPTNIMGSTEVQEEPKALPLVQKSEAAIAPVTQKEVWLEDEREVLIRSERGTKNNNNNSNNNNNNGSGTGKRGKNKKLKTSTDSTQGSNEEVSELTNSKQTNTKQSNKKNITNAEDEQIPSSCRYVKSQWTECDPSTNTRSRTLTLKKAEDGCVPTRTIQKKCKKAVETENVKQDSNSAEPPTSKQDKNACRYEKGTWSECISGQMSRTDKLKSTSDPVCQATRVINKNCNPGKSKDKGNKDRKNKEKGGRKGRA